MPSSKSTRAALAAGALLLLPGCFKSYVAVSFRPPIASAGEAEVHTAPRLTELRDGIRTVAVRAPAACAAEGTGTAAGEGVAGRGRAILESRCAIFLSELERALAARWQVVPWRTLADAEGKAGAIHLAARQAGVDAVLVVTDLAPTPILVSDAFGPSVALSDANPDGSARGPARLSRKGERFIRSLVAARFPDGGLAGVAVHLEVSAIAASTGEPLWSYQRRVTEDLDGALDLKMLLRGRGKTWRPVVPRGYRAARAARRDAAAEDPVRTHLRSLAQGLARDVVERFANAG